MPPDRPDPDMQAARTSGRPKGLRLRSARIFAVATTILASVVCPVGRAATTAVVNPRNDWGSWEGWGVSLCWWAHVFGQRDDLADLVFTLKPTFLKEAGATLPGLGLNIVRYNAGACTPTTVNGATMVVSPNIPAFRQIDGYWLNGDNNTPPSRAWNWNADANQRAMLLKARDRGANRFELFSNSPMWWMCENHNPSGSANGTDDNLGPGFYRRHAIYLATIAQHFRDAWGLTFTSVEPFNEPTADWWKAAGTQEGCHFSPVAQAKVIADLHAELAKRGLTSTIVSGSDESYYQQALDTWTQFDPATRAALGRVNVHGYQYDAGPRSRLFAAVAGKKLWNSEYGDKDGSGLSMAVNLNRDFHQLHLTAWCYWQALDGGGWGLVQSNPGEHWIGHANPKYYVLAQYCRHIRSGMTILDSGDADSIAAYDAAARKLVIVTVNAGPARTVTYDLSRFSRAAGPVSRWITRTDGGELYSKHDDVPLSGRKFTCATPAKAVQTFEVQNVDLVSDRSAHAD